MLKKDSPGVWSKPTGTCTCRVPADMHAPKMNGVRGASANCRARGAKLGTKNFKHDRNKSVKGVGKRLAAGSIKAHGAGL